MMIYYCNRCGTGYSGEKRGRVCNDRSQFAGIKELGSCRGQLDILPPSRIEELQTLTDNLQHFLRSWRETEGVVQLLQKQTKDLESRIRQLDEPTLH